MKNKLKDCHAREDKLNKEIGIIDKEIKALLKRKKKLAISVSKNMKYRNMLIEKQITNK